MALRNRVRGWPPVWAHITPDVQKHEMGEIGALSGAYVLEDAPRRLYLLMQLDQLPYVGTMVFSDAGLCNQFHRFLQEHIGQPIREIGDLDFSYTV
jgi:hypothetical protein